MQSTVPGVNTSLETQLTVKISQASKNMPRQWQLRLFSICLVISDTLMLGIGFRLAHFLLFETGFSLPSLAATDAFYLHRLLVLATVSTWLVIFAAIGLYRRQNFFGASNESFMVFKGTAAGVLLALTVDLLFPGVSAPRNWVLLSWLLAFLSTTSGRFALHRLVGYLREYGYFLSPAVIVGANNEGLTLAKQLMSWRSSGLHILGFLDKKLPAGKKVIKHLYCLGSVDELEAIVERYGVEEIILATSAFPSGDEVLEIYKRYSTISQVNVCMSSDLV